MMMARWGGVTQAPMNNSIFSCRMLLHTIAYNVESTLRERKKLAWVARSHLSPKFVQIVGGLVLARVHAYTAMPPPPVKEKRLACARHTRKPNDTKKSRGSGHSLTDKRFPCIRHRVSRRILCARRE